MPLEKLYTKCSRRSDALPATNAARSPSCKCASSMVQVVRLERRRGKTRDPHPPSFCWDLSTFPQKHLISPAYSQSLGGEAPGTPQGEAVGQVFKPLGSLAYSWAYSCTAALPSSSSRQLAGLPLLFLWASKSDVRHFAPPLNPPRAFKPFPAPLAYSCIAALLASGGSLGREPWNVQPVLLWASKSDVRHFKPLGSLAYSCTAALPSSSSRQLAGLPLLFLWASKSDVRHFAPPLNPPRAFFSAASQESPCQRLWPTPASQPCLASGGQPGARALGTLQPVNSPAASKPFPAPLAYSCIAALPCLCVRREPGERASAACLAYSCTAAAFRGSLAYSCTAALPSSSSRQLAGLPLLFLWASKSDVRHFAPPLNPPRAFKPFPAPLAYSCIAALLASGGSLGREPWNVQPVLLWASKSDVRHFAPPLNPPRAFKPFPAPLALLHRSRLRQAGAWGESPGTCSPCSYGLPKATLGISNTSAV